MSGQCPAVALAEQNALPRRVNSVDGEGRIVAEVPPDEDAGDIVDEFLAEHPDAELVARRQQPYTTPLFSHREFQQVVEEELTERQRDVLSTAHEAGYYEWPREMSGEELAAELDISPPTFQQHLRSAERKLVTALFEVSATLSDEPGGAP